MYSFFVISHLLGIILGAGSAFVSDSLFFGILHDRKIEKSESSLLHIVSRMVWVGLSVAVLSGLGLLYTVGFGLLSDGRFQAKLIILGVIIINGIVFHWLHLPFINDLVGKISLTKKITTVISRGRFVRMFISGALSLPSWLFVIILGSFRGVTFSLGLIMSAYVIVVLLSALVSYLLMKHMFPRIFKKHTHQQSPSIKKGVLLYITIIIASLAFLLSLVSLSQTARSQFFTTNANRGEVVLTPKDQLLPAPVGEEHLSYAPEVPAAITRNKQRFFEVHLEVLENVCSLDDEEGISFDTWGYRVKGDTEVLCGAPGPILRGRVGDVARITLTNLPDNTHPHNIDFHAVTGQGGGAKDLTVVPGETASIDVRLLYPGAFMYHCAYGDVPVHISHGMYGMFIVDPETPLPAVDHEWAVMQSEWYLDSGEGDRLATIDRDKLSDEEPTLITFNGKVGALTGDNALAMNVGERARIYFVNEGLNLASNFHPIGSHWDLVYPEAATHSSNQPLYGSQSTLVVAGGGTVTELVARLPGSILLVDHALSRTFYKGALGIINVAGEPNPELFSVVQSPGKEGEKDTSSLESSQVDVVIPPGAALRSNADKAYLPGVVRIKKGETVTWKNTDSVMHTVTSGEGGEARGIKDNIFDSGFMRAGDTFSHTFNESGTFPYFCTPHPWATGTVIVE